MLVSFTCTSTEYVTNSNCTNIAFYIATKDSKRVPKFLELYEW